MGGGPGRELRWPPGLQEELPQFDHLGTREILDLRSAHEVAFASNFKGKLAVGLLIDALGVGCLHHGSAKSGHMI